MASSFRGLLTKAYNPVKNLFLNSFDVNYTITRNYAARKGTREKARLKKLKIQQKKVAQAPTKIPIKKMKQQYMVRSLFDRREPICDDNVYISKYHQIKLYTVEEAVVCHQETHHSSIYNSPNDFVNAIIELNMVAEKKTRFVDQFRRLLLLPHPFVFGEKKSVLVLCKTPELQLVAENAGADLFGGLELIKSIENGDLSVADFESIIAHTNIITEVLTIKGLLKKKFPSPKTGTLGADLEYMISRIKKGLMYECKKGEEHDFGWIQTPIGTLEMSSEKLEQNLRAIIKDVNMTRPRRDGTYINYCWLTSPPSDEKLKIDLSRYLPPEQLLIEGPDSDEVKAGDEVDKERKLVEAV